MSVDPLKSNALPHADPGRSGASAAARRADTPAAADTQPDHAAAVAGDRVQLSAASKTLQADNAEQVPQGTVTAERMREVLQRLATDHYHSAEVRDRVALGVQQDLGLEAGVVTP